MNTEQKRITDFSDEKYSLLKDFIQKSLESTEWTHDEHIVKLKHPDLFSPTWENDIFIKALDLNRESRDPLPNQEIYDLVVSIAQPLTLSRLDSLKTQPRKTLFELLNTEYPASRFVVEPFIEQGQMNMISAPPSTWKSWLFFLIAEAVSSGRPLFGQFKTEQAKVLIVNEEDSERLIADRFKALGVTDGSLPIFFRVAHSAVLDEKFCRLLLEECIKDEITVVMFDSLRSLHNADENSSTAMKEIMDNMKILTHAGITVVFTHHHKKKNQFSRADDPENARGASSIVGDIFGSLMLEEDKRDDGTYLIVHHTKSKSVRKADPFELKIDIDGPSVSFTYAGIHEDDVATATIARNAIYDFLVAKNSFVTVNEIISAGLASKTNAQRSLDGMRTSGLVQCLSQGLIAQHYALQLPGRANLKYYRAKKPGETDDIADLFE